MPKKKGSWQVWLESLDKAAREATGEGLVSIVGKFLSDLTSVPPPPSAAQQAEMAKAKEVKKIVKATGPYAVLGVPPDSPDWVVQSAYQRAAKKVHPDVPGGSNEKMKELNKAYEEIKKERKL